MKSVHWRVLAYVALALVTAGGVWDLRNRGEREAAMLRQNQITSCEVGNETRLAIRDFLQKTVQPPRPESYAYITDPALREGVIRQATERYNSTKRDTDEAFKPRDCNSLFPK